jgi:uncharacterized protein YbjT (DUF2867 family)
VAKQIVLDGAVPATVVKSTQWYEFATNPAAVTGNDGEVIVEDWLIQPIAADTVADVLVEAALGQIHSPRTITGPDVMRLPDLTSKLLARQGDGRRVRAVQPQLPGLAAGALLLPMAPESSAPTSKLGCILWHQRARRAARQRTRASNPWATGECVGSEANGPQPSTKRETKPGSGPSSGCHPVMILRYASRTAGGRLISG